MNIIRLHKGNITIDSKVAQGTHISIILPVAGSQPLNLEKTIPDMPAYN
jgi:signal transduction histidine kinase